MIQCLLDESGGYTTPVMQHTPIDPSHGTRPADGLFAASAEAAITTLMTLNRELVTFPDAGRGACALRQGLNPTLRGRCPGALASSPAAVTGSEHAPLITRPPVLR